MTSTRLAAVTTDFTDQLIADARYEVRERLGTGSMGHVFRAWDNRLETDVVIKVPTLARLENEQFRQRFLKESRFLVKLTHPHIVTILDVGEHGGVPYFVMQYVGGGSLESRIHPAPKKYATQKLKSLKEWLPGTAAALDFMHGRGYVHRDIKPGNILFDEYGSAYLSDFGLSKILAERDDDSGMTAAGVVVGTPNYVAPEVVLGQKYDGQADQYSLAMTLYEALTGRCPLEGPSASATMVNQTAKMPPPPTVFNAGVPEALSAVILRGLSKPPDKRYPNCVEFTQAVLEAAGLIDSGVREASTRTSDGHSRATSILTAPQFSVVKRVKVKNLRAPCPKCARVLKLKAEFAGRKGFCNKCKTPILISRDLKEVQQVRLIKRNGVSVRDGFDLAIGTEVFGFKLTRQQALILIAILMVVLVAAAVIIGVSASQKDETELDPVLRIYTEQRPQ